MNNGVIITADWHLRNTVPSCIDATFTEWMNIQKEALAKIIDIAVGNNASGIYHCGDVFHSERTTSFECIQMVQDFAKECDACGIDFFIVAGNHDELNHSTSNLHKSAIGILFKSKYIYDMNNSKKSIIHGCNFDIDDYDGYENIAKHILCIPKEQKSDFIECETPETLLVKYSKSKRIFLGDYHRNFVYKSSDDRYVINPGCLTKQAADFESYCCGVYYVRLDSNTEVKWCPVNIEQKFVRNGGSVKVDKSVDDFVNGIKKESVTLDFIGTLRNELAAQKKDVQDKVEGWIENIGQ